VGQETCGGERACATFIRPHKTGSNGGKMNRFWGGGSKVDACGPRDSCSDKCAYEPCNVGTIYKVECPGNCGHYGADVFGGAG
jgi:hypothetical protein